LPPTAAAREARLNLDRLEVKVGGTENDPPEPQFNFTYLAANSADKDIKARLRHKVELVRFKAGEGDQFFLVDSADQFLLDASSKPIPLDRANAMPRERLSWVTIALEGQEDYVEDVVIQQGASARFRHLLQMPNRQQLPVPLPLPMRYSLTVEAAGLSAIRSVDFALLKTAERPKLYAAAAVRSAPAAIRAAPMVAPIATPAAANPVSPTESSSPASSYKLKRANNLFSDTSPKRKVVGRLLLNAVVNIDESSEVITAGKPVTWVKVSATTGLSGWLPKSELMETK
jgi:hypothetical protein